jgi:hypothetical protein
LTVNLVLLNKKSPAFARLFIFSTLVQVTDLRHLVFLVMDALIRDFKAKQAYA